MSSMPLQFVYFFLSAQPYSVGINSSENRNFEFFQNSWLVLLVLNARNIKKSENIAPDPGSDCRQSENVAPDPGSDCRQSENVAPDQGQVRFKVRLGQVKLCQLYELFDIPGIENKILEISEISEIPGSYYFFSMPGISKSFSIFLSSLELGLTLFLLLSLAVLLLMCCQ